MFTAEKNRMRLAARPIQKQLQANITWLERELTSTDLSTTIRESPVWREKEEVLRSVPGVRLVLTTTLFGNLPELGILTRTEVAAVASIARSRATAGHSKGEAPSGEAAFYQGLCHAGKAKTLAVTACLRKLLTILNAMLKSGMPWRVAGVSRLDFQDSC